MSTGTGRRMLSLLVLGLVVAGGLQAWSLGWFEKGVPVNLFVQEPPRAAAVDPAALAAREREQEERRRRDDLHAVMMAMRDAESTVNREQRCLAMPDPPGSQWPQGSAAARCALLRKPVLTLAVMRELLSRGTPSPLRRLHADLLTAHFEDPARREQIFLAYRQFDESAAAAAAAAAWLRASPRDPYAQAAAGWQRVSAVAALRGADVAVPATPEQVAAMQAIAAETWPLLDAALVGEPKLLPACVAAARLGRLTGENARQQQALRHCLGVDAMSYHVLEEQAQGAQPRWGGSLSALEVVATQASAAQERFPALATLAALPQIAIAEQAPPDQVAVRWDAALRPGPAPDWALAAAADALAASDPWQALVLRSQAMRFDPCQDPCHRRERLRLLLQLQQWDWARSEAQALLVDTPDDWTLLRSLWEAREALAAAALGARGQPVVAQPAAVWLTPFEGCLEAIGQIETRRAEAKACSEKMAVDLPENPYSWYLRARYLRAADQPGADVALRQMAATLDRSRPEQSALLDRMRDGQAPVLPNTRGWSRRPN